MMRDRRMICFHRYRKNIESYVRRLVLQRVEIRLADAAERFFLLIIDGEIGVGTRIFGAHTHFDKDHRLTIHHDKINLVFPALPIASKELVALRNKRILRELFAPIARFLSGGTSAFFFPAKLPLEPLKHHFFSSSATLDKQRLSSSFRASPDRMVSHKLMTNEQSMNSRPIPKVTSPIF